MNNEKLPEQLKNAWNKLKAAIKGVSRKTWILLAVIVVVIAAAITVYWYTRPYSILVTGASPEEVTTVMTWLENQGVRDYRLQGTDTILVPDKQASVLKASLLTETYSSSSAGFTGYFNTVSALSTEKERNAAWRVAVQEEIEEVITAFPGVNWASVLINEGQDMSYVLDAGNVVLPSVGIIVDMASGQSLTAGQAAAIRSYVANGIRGLTAENVSISDTRNNTYNSISGQYDFSSASALKLQLEEEYSNKIRSQVFSGMSKLFGEEHVDVGVNCVVDVDTREITDHQVHLPEYAQDGSTNGAGIIGSRVFEYIFKASEETIASGVVGTTTNSDNDIPDYVEQNPDPDSYVGVIQGGGQTDFNNSTTDTHTYGTAGYLKDCTVAVTIDSNAASAPLDIVSLRRHVATAAGISANELTADEFDDYLSTKISIYAGPFPETPADGDNILPNPLPVDSWVIYAAIGGLALFLLILIIILVLRSRSRKKRQQEEQARQLAEAQETAMEQLLAAAAGAEVPEPTGADVMSLQSERSMALRQDIRKFAEENPEIAAQMVKSWLRGGEESA